MLSRELRSSGILRSVCWLIPNRRFGKKPNGPIFKGQALQEEIMHNTLYPV
jgi:hypothetical protein